RVERVVGDLPGPGDADDVVDLLAVDGVGAVPGLADQRDEVGDGRGAGQRPDLRPRHHDLVGGQVAERQGALQQARQVGGQVPGAVRLADDVAELLQGRAAVDLLDGL